MPLFMLLSSLPSYIFTYSIPDTLVEVCLIDNGIFEFSDFIVSKTNALKKRDRLSKTVFFPAQNKCFWVTALCPVTWDSRL